MCLATLNMSDGFGYGVCLKGNGCWVVDVFGEIFLRPVWLGLA